MRFSWTLIVVAVLAASGCSGGGGSNGSVTPTPTPTPGPSGGTNAVTVDIVGSSGSQAFSPNPVQAASGMMVVWKNDTTVVHHLVMDDGSADFGNIAPGASSLATAVSASGGTYHCLNHPSMVGSINGSSAPQPPADGGGDVTY
jgi:plastocyanin